MLYECAYDQANDCGTDVRPAHCKMDVLVTVW